jgi:hypothetical protein
MLERLIRSVDQALISEVTTTTTTRHDRKFCQLQRRVISRSRLPHQEGCRMFAGTQAQWNALPVHLSQSIRKHQGRSKLVACLGFLPCCLFLSCDRCSRARSSLFVLLCSFFVLHPSVLVLLVVRSSFCFIVRLRSPLLFVFVRRSSFFVLLRASVC